MSELEIEYPGSAPLTWGHVNANVGHILWNARVTSDPPHAVRAFYETKLGPGEVRDDGTIVWRRPAEQPETVLDVGPAHRSGPHASAPIPPGMQTVILFSRMTRT